MRVTEVCFDLVVKSTRNELVLACAYPDRFLTEHDLQAWIVRRLISDLNAASDNAEVGIHCQPRYLDGDGRLSIEPDIVVFNKGEYSIDPSGELAPRKGFTFWGSSIAIELKLFRGNRTGDVTLCLRDIRKLAELRSIHYSCEQRFRFWPLFCVYSRGQIPENLRSAIEFEGAEQEVKVLMVAENEAYTANQAR